MPDAVVLGIMSGFDMLTRAPKQCDRPESDSNDIYCRDEC